MAGTVSETASILSNVSEIGNMDHYTFKSGATVANQADNCLSEISGANLIPVVSSKLDTILESLKIFPTFKTHFNSVN